MNHLASNSVAGSTAIPASPVDNELARIDNALNSLDTELGNLCARMGTVLEPESQEKQTAEAGAGSIRSIERSWLHGNLRAKADKIESMTAAVNALRNRVTL